MDFQSHPSFAANIKSQGACTRTYDHGDATSFHHHLENAGDLTIGLFTDSLFPLSGCIAPLPQSLDALRISNVKSSIVVIDEAHSLGVLGPTGGGIFEHFGIKPTNENRIEFVITGSMAKALGSHGGYIAGSAERIQLIRERSTIARGFLPPSCAHAAYAGLELLKDPARLAGLRGNIRKMRDVLESLGFSGLTADPSIPFFCIEDSPTRPVAAIHGTLMREGVYAALISGYSATQSGAILRLVVNHDHTDEDFAILNRALAKAAKSQPSLT